MLNSFGILLRLLLVGHRVEWTLFARVRLPICLWGRTPRLWETGRAFEVATTAARGISGFDPSKRRFNLHGKGRHDALSAGFFVFDLLNAARLVEGIRFWVRGSLADLRLGEEEIRAGFA